MVIGDWGGLPLSPFTTEIEKAVAHQMGKFADDNNIQFVLALGDNFYFDGVKDVDDPRFGVSLWNLPGVPSFNKWWLIIVILISNCVQHLRKRYKWLDQVVHWCSDKECSGRGRFGGSRGKVQTGKLVD